LQDRELVITVQIDASDFRNPLSEGENSPISSLAHISDHRTFDKFSTRKSEKLPAEVQESLEKALKVLKKKMQLDGLQRELKNRRFYEKPSVKKRRKMQEAERRRRKARRRHN